MKKLKLLLAGFVFTASLGVILSLTSGKAFAATKTWDGGGSDDKFSTAANWNGDSAPVNGDSLVFPVSVVMGACSANVTLDNDLNSGSITLAGISFTQDLADCIKNLTISGNEIKLSGNVAVNSTVTAYYYSTIKLETDVTLTAPISYANNVNGNTFYLGTSETTLAMGSHNLTASGTGSGGISVEAAITGSGTLTLSSGISGSLYLHGENADYTGPIVLNAGTLSVTKATDLGSSAGGTTVNGGTLSLSLPDGTTFSEPLTFNGGKFSVYSGTYSGNYPWSSTSATLPGTIEFAQSTEVGLSFANLKLTGAVTNSNNIALVAGGVGNITLPDGTVLSPPLKTYTVTDANKMEYCYSSQYGLILPLNTRYIWNIACSEQGTEANPNKIYGIFSGTGSLTTPVKVMAGGTIAPGESPGILTVGSLTFEEGGTYQAEIGGTEAGQYDQIKVIGTVTLGNATLNTSFWENFRPKGDDKFVIIDNDGADAVTGTFKDLPEGATFTVDGVVFRINYTGGDGNDVVLTVISTPAAPDTGVGLLTSKPLALFATTSALAGGIYLIARKQKLFAK